MTATIRDLRAVPGNAAFFFDDQAAIIDGAPQDGAAYGGTPQTTGFHSVREPGKALLLELELSTGQTVHGDCAAVQYSGAGGRDPLFRARKHRRVVEQELAPELIGREATTYAENESLVKTFETNGETLHTAVKYGVSGVLLKAAATVRGTTMTQVLADRFGTTPATEPVAIFGQTGDERCRQAEKMILKRADVLPHGLFNSLSKIGPEGEKLREYLAWLSGRVDDLGNPEYSPQFHVDVYGMIGRLFEPPYDRPAVIDYMESLAAAAAPYGLQIEEPVDVGSRTGQLERFRELRTGLRAADVPVEIVADEWCDTLADVKAFVDAGAADLVQVKTPDLGVVGDSARAVTYTHGTDVDAYVGGSCNETDLTARITAHIALATDARQVLAKPGMGFDEGHMIVTNEMARTLAAHRRQPRRAASND